MDPEFIDSLVVKNSTKIIFLIMDGLGGLPMGERDQTELEAAKTPNMDALAFKIRLWASGPCWIWVTRAADRPTLPSLDMIHQEQHRRGIWRPLVLLPYDERDLLIRINFATIDKNGVVIDRRAGRIDNETIKESAESCRTRSGKYLMSKLSLNPSENTGALLALRRDRLREEIQETDPQKRGFRLYHLKPSSGSRRTSGILQKLIDKAKEVLSDEEKANMLLLRGYSTFRRYPYLSERFGLNALAICHLSYVPRHCTAFWAWLLALSRIRSRGNHGPPRELRKYDFFFVHVKATDSRGEDGNFDAKVKVIEEVDSLVPMVTDLKPDVLVIHR